MNTADPRASRFVHAGATPRIGVSFEFFPPKTAEMEATLWEAINRLAPLKPKFVSVTYGAGGSTRERTHATVKRILAETMLVPAAHLTCVGATCPEVDAVIHGYREAGVRHIVALRGDPLGGLGEPYAPHPGGYRHAADLVAGIKRIADIEVSVSAYPERHPDSPTVEADIDMLAAKVDAGASRAITQFFFENDLYFRYLDRVRARGIELPIVPGILPVQNIKQTKSFAARCGTSVPDWLAERFDGLDHDPMTRKLIAAAVAAEQVIDLVDRGVTDFHFYTMNRADLVYAVCHLLGLRPGDGGRAEACAPTGNARSRQGRGRRKSKAMSDTGSNTARHVAHRAAPSWPGGRAHPGARRRHGHHDPGAQARRGRLSGRPLRCLEPRRAGQQRSLDPLPARGGARHSSRLFSRRRRHRLDQHLLLDLDRAGRLRPVRSCARAQSRRRQARPRRGGDRAGRGRPSAFRGRRHRADQPDRLDLARRGQSGLPRHHLRRAARRLCGADRRPDRGRRRSVADRDHLRHAQRQGRHLRGRRGDAGARRAAAGDDLRHHHGSFRPPAVRADPGGVLEFGAPCRAGVDRAELRARGEGDARPRGGDRAHRRHAGLRLSECRAAQRIRLLRREPRLHGRADRRVRRGRPRQHRRRLLRHHARPHRRHRARGRRQGAAQHSAGAAPAAPVGAGGFHADAGNSVREYRRAHQRHRLGAVPQAGHRRRLHQRARRGARSGRERRPDHRREHGRRPARFGKPPWSPSSIWWRPSPTSRAFRSWWTPPSSP